ncbi:MAG TPA: alanine--tRNA ligase, partial [Opitutae bacterium]|nr:alanine--tRNA ligase [Opitutae bacterium]
TGTLTSEGGATLEVFDTKKENNLIVHFIHKLPASLDNTFHAQVHSSKRLNSQRNHTATHLLHEVLREILGTHVEQKGSLVKAESLRFDFSHFAKVSPEEIEEIELRVNQRIQCNFALKEFRDLPLDEAKNKGAMMLFGEKYGERVRMIEFGTSRELCGGTHAPATGVLGLFRITQETAVASGVRRIEASTGMTAVQLARDEQQALQDVRNALKAPQDLNKAVEDLLRNQVNLQKELDGFRQQAAQDFKTKVIEGLETIDGINVFIGELPLDTGAIKDIAFQLRNEHPPFFGVFGSRKGDKPTLSVALSDGLVEERELNASMIVRELAKAIQGGGGGQPFFATAGGKNPDGLEDALKAARLIVH